VRMRYLIDSCVDQMLAAVYTSITSPPLLQNPFGKVMSLVRQFGCRMERGQTSNAQLERIQSNALTKVGPQGSFMYAGTSPYAKHGNVFVSHLGTWAFWTTVSTWACMLLVLSAWKLEALADHAGVQGGLARRE
jgi:hypothetical protein